MAAWRYIGADLRTNTLLGDLPLTDVSYSEVLNGAGTFSGTLPLAVDAATSSTTRASVAAILTASSQPGRTVVWMVRDGVVLGGAIVWSRKRRKGQPATLAGAGLWSFFRMQHLRSTLAFAGVDQLAIARSLIQTAQAVNGADIGVQLGTETSGVLRDRTFNSWELKQVGEAVEQLAAVNGGFDFAVDVTQGFGKVLTLSSPRRGRPAGTTAIVFADGKNLLDYEVSEDATRAANVYSAVGDGDGAATMISTATRTDQLDIGYPLLSEVGAFKDISVRATLDARAISGVDARATVPTFWQLTVDPDDLDGGLGTFTVGDDAIVEVPDDDNFPRQLDGQPGYRAVHRIVGFEVSIPSQGRETLTVTVGTGATSEQLLPDGRRDADLDRRIRILES